MGNSGNAILVPVLSLFSFMLIGQAYADSAEVMPKGVFSAEIKYSYYFTINKRFDPDGREEDLATDFNANLNNGIFSDLALIEKAFGMPPGSASLGSSVVRFDYRLHDLILKLYYGLTDKISIGMKIPYFFNNNAVRARLDTGNATVGLNPFVPGGIAPLAVPGTRPFTTDDVRKLLGRGLDVDGDGIIDIPGYGYKKFQSWKGSGFSDIDIGLRYQYLNTKNWRLAVTGGFRVPTGETDDPDNLVDIGFGTGAYALLFRLHNDFVGIKNLVLDATIKYDLVFPQHETRRVLISVDRPITSNKERVRTNKGDVVELETSATYELLEGLSVSLLYDYSFKFRDKVRGNQGFAYSSLEDETDWTAHYFTLGLSYSTVPLFKKKMFPIPLTAAIEYENWFAGSNNTLKQQLINFYLTAYF